VCFTGLVARRRCHDAAASRDLAALWHVPSRLSDSKRLEALSRRRFAPSRSPRPVSRPQQRLTMAPSVRRGPTHCSSSPTHCSSSPTHGSPSGALSSSCRGHESSSRADDSSRKANRPSWQTPSAIGLGSPHRVGDTARRVMRTADELERMLHEVV
jgi:hypothetical protein